MEDELARLREALATAQRLREAAETRASEAEDVARASLPQILEGYLEACHSLSLAIEVITDRSLTI